MTFEGQQQSTEQDDTQIEEQSRTADTAPMTDGASSNASPTASRPVIDQFGEPVEELIKIPIEDNGEPLVDIFEVCPKIRWAIKSPRFDFPRTGLARVSVANMLKQAQELLPDGLYLQIVGAFRPFEVQQKMYAAARAEFAAQHPDWDEELLTEYVNVFSAPPIWDTPPPHTTGGAVDLSIVDESGKLLDMVSPYAIGWDSAPTYIEGLSEEARRNRDLLISVLTESGMTNFLGEWWHWSWGEPGWALRTGRPVALYGAVPADQVPPWSPPH